MVQDTLDLTVLSVSDYEGTSLTRHPLTGWLLSRDLSGFGPTSSTRPCQLMNCCARVRLVSDETRYSLGCHTTSSGLVHGDGSSSGRIPATEIVNDVALCKQAQGEASFACQLNITSLELTPLTQCSLPRWS